MVKGYARRIVNVASIAGKEGNPMAAAYAASKAAVIALTKAFGSDLPAARPGQLHRIGGDRDPDPRRDLTRAHRLHGRADSDGADGDAGGGGALVCWLASDECSFSTGATYDISGGRAVY